MSEKKIIDKEILYNLYIIQNKTAKEIATIFKKSRSLISQYLRNNNIIKPKEQISLTKREAYFKKSESEKQKILSKMEQTKLNKYGDKFYTNTEKRKKTNLERYGNENYINVEKIKKTHLSKSKKEIREANLKTEQTKLEKYGNKYYFNRDKLQKTNLEKYGTISSLSNKEVQIKRKATMIKKYGAEYVFNSPILKEKIKKTNLLKYNCESANQKHLSQETIKILSTKENLENWIKKQEIKTPFILSQKLNFNFSGFLEKVKKFELRELLTLRYSSYEIELQQLLTSWNIKYEINNRNIIKPYELDIYIPLLNIAIEFNGTFWHSEKYKSNNYHIDKSNLCKEQEIQLIHIWEYEWERDKEKIINYLKDILNINQKIIYGRNCIIQEIDSRAKNIFLNENHLQGEDKASLKYGLFHNNELIGVMTWGKPRFNKKFDWELSRLCFKSGYKVIGGAEKLFKYKPEGNLISYCNISKFKGSVYKKLDFTLSHISPPNYVWTNGSEILSRYKCQMKNENKIMTDKGFYKIYDCGNQVWIFTVNY